MTTITTRVIQIDCDRNHYLDSSDFLSLSLHIFGFIAMPVHLYGAYCILAKTPITMNSMKWPLFNFHFWTCFLDIELSILFIPYIFFPALAGYPLGLLSYFGIGMAEQIYIMLTNITFATVSIIGIFEKRFSIISGPHRYWKVLRKPLYFLNYLAAICCFLPVYIMTPEQKVAIEFLRKFITCTPAYADESQLFIITMYTRYFLVPSVLCYPFWFSQILFFSISTSWLLKEQVTRSNSMSVKTLEMQKKFQRALVMQVAIPVIIFFIPLLYIGLSTAMWYHDQTFNNFTFLILSSHGFFSTIAMIFLHTAYREFTFGIFCSKLLQYEASSSNFVVMTS